jgi:predicted amidohydrolase YtcJ
LDGALGTQTALMFKPYEGSKNRGVSTLDKRELDSCIAGAESRGISCAIHAIGDKAVYDVINSYRKHSNGYNLRLPRRIEHAQIMRGQDIPLMKGANIVASVQPNHIFQDRDTGNKYWGDRCRYIYAFKSMLKNRISLTFGSDAPIGEVNPIMAIFAAVNRRRPDDDRGPWYGEERITAKQAVAGFTTGPAYTGGLKNVTGKLLPGYFADIVVLSDDIFRIDRAEIDKAKVLSTICSGKFEYGNRRF